MRLRYAVVGVMFASSLGGLAYGCGGDSSESSLPIENLCGWVDDPANCLRAYYLDIGQECGSANEKETPHGHFITRDMLDTCVIDGGGQVLFSNLDLSQFPLGVPHFTADGGITLPDAVTFQMVKATGDECGNGSFTSNESWTLTIDSCPPDAGAPPPFGSGGSNAGGAGGAGGTGSGNGGAGGTPSSAGCNRGGKAGGSGGATTIFGGTYAMSENGDLVDVTCPSGEAHHFDELSEEKCPKVSNLFPFAEMITDPGNTEKPGYIWFRVHYPPGASVPATATNLEGFSSEIINYFICEIPKAPHECMDGMKDGAETDVDCGGPLDTSVSVACPARCGPGQACFVAADCANKDCIPDETGLNHCNPDNMASGSSSASASSSGAGGAGGN
jgi:hypothetical protein